MQDKKMSSKVIVESRQVQHKLRVELQKIVFEDDFQGNNDKEVLKIGSDESFGTWSETILNAGDRIVGATGYVGSEDDEGSLFKDPGTMYGISFLIYNEVKAKDLESTCRTGQQTKIVAARKSLAARPQEITSDEEKILH